MGDRLPGCRCLFCDPLGHRRDQDENDTFYDNPVCPCEVVELEPQSEYDVNGEWITYTGEVDVRIFDEAARYAEADVAQDQADANERMVAEAQSLSGSSAETAPSAPVLDEDELPIDPIHDERPVNTAVQRARDIEDAAERATVEAMSALHIAESARLSIWPDAVELAERAQDLVQSAAEAINTAQLASVAAEQTTDAYAQENATQVPQAQSAATEDAHTQSAADECQDLEEFPVDPIKDEWSVFVAKLRAESAAIEADRAAQAADEAHRVAIAARVENLPDASRLTEIAIIASRHAFEAAAYAQRAEVAAQRAAEEYACAEAEAALAKAQNAESTHEEENSE